MPFPGNRVAGSFGGPERPAGLAFLSFGQLEAFAAECTPKCDNLGRPGEVFNKIYHSRAVQQARAVRGAGGGHRVAEEALQRLPWAGGH